MSSIRTWRFNIAGQRTTTIGSQRWRPIWSAAKAGLGLRFNEHLEGDGPTVFAHACKMGLEGIVSKRKDSAYRSGRSLDWLKSKNPACEALRREAEEDWGR